MTISLISKQELNIINRRTLKYDLSTAEKDYFLAVVLKIIFESSLKDKLVFKGGTAIHHCYLPQYRFSEDLDFTAIDPAVTVEEIKTVLENTGYIIVKKEYRSKATIKLERVQYQGPLGLPNFLKVEIDCMQNVAIPPKKIEYKNVWGVQASVMVMDINEICAEKVRACSGRARYRDFYDLFLIFNEFNPHWDKVIELIKQKEIREPISKASVFKNWDVAIQEKKEELAQIHYSKPVGDDAVKSFIDDFPFSEFEKKK
ncbi:MAG: nucleotidyl transferase AbiEii/AbiGii toxin family protein [Elusimicrobia bacterium]|nr:nucleotidyl transferase AbiEii/AbiGii toxin family protein [Elusimicrobiota bacterium]